MMYTVKEEGRVLRIDLSGEIDHHNARALREGVDREICFFRPREVELHLGGVTFMDSAGLGFFMGRYALCRQLGAAFSLCEVSAEVEKILRVSGFDKILCAQGAQ